MLCPITLFKPSHSFPQLPKCWLLMAQRCVSHQESATKKHFIKVMLPPGEKLITNALLIERYNYRDSVSMWRQLWRLLELPVGLPEASAATTPGVSVFLCPIMAFSLLPRYNSQELCPVNLYTTLHSRVCFLGTQLKIVGAWIEPVS